MSAMSHVALTDAAIQFACFTVAAALQTEKFYDISASLTYIICILVSRRKGVRSSRSTVNSTLVVLWAMRLGSFLLWRVIHDGGDSRFAKAKTKPLTFFIFWAIQALWIFITALPVYLANTRCKTAASEQNLEEGTTDEAGTRKYNKCHKHCMMTTLKPRYQTSQMGLPTGFTLNMTIFATWGAITCHHL